MATGVRAVKASGAATSALTVAMPGHDAIGLRAAQGSNNAGGGTSITMAFPTGLVAGDVMLMAVTARAGITDPGGWTPLDGSNSGTTLYQRSYWKVATAADVTAGSVAVTLTSSKASGVIIALTVADTTAPAAAQHGAQVNASSATVTSPALTLGGSYDGMEVVFSGTAYGTTCTPVTLTEPANGESASTGGGASSRTTTEVEYGTYSGSAPPSRTATMGNAAVNIGHHIFIKVAQQTVAMDGDVLLAAIVAGSGESVFSTNFTWTTRTNPLTSGSDVCYQAAYGNGYWVIVGSTGGAGDAAILTSTDDGVTWVQRASVGSPWASGINGYSVGYGDGVFVIGAEGGGGKIAYATDPTGTWTVNSDHPFTNNIINIAYGDGTWVASDQSGHMAYATDPTGTWTLISQSIWTGSGLYPVSICYGNGMWVAGGNNKFATASDPTGTWTQHSTVNPSGYDPYHFAYGNGVWVGTYNGDNTYYATDPAGTWTLSPCTLGTTTMLGGPGFGNGYGRGMFVIAAGGKVSASFDGIYWWAERGTNAGDFPAYGNGVWLTTMQTNPGDPRTSPAPPEGSWVSLASAYQSPYGDRQHIYWKVASSEPASYVFNSSASNMSGIVVVLSDASPTVPDSAQYGGQAGTTASITAPALGSWDATDGMDVAFFVTGASTTIAPPTDYTEPIADTVVGTAITAEVSYRALASATTVASIVATAGSAANNVGHHVFIKIGPAPAIVSGVASNNGAGATTIVVSVPTGVTDGDVLVLGVSAAGGSTNAIYPPNAAWVAKNPNVGGYAPSLAYGDGLWVAQTSDHYYSTATDPSGTWTSRSNPFGGLTASVLYGDGLWVAFASSYPNTIVYTTTDPTGAWTQRATLSFAAQIAYGNGVWVAYYNNYLYTTTDPTGSWTQNTDASWTPDNTCVMVYGNGIWVAAQFNGTTRNLTATDPSGTWTSRSVVGSGGPPYFAGEYFFAQGSLGTSKTIWISDDGINWAEYSVPFYSGVSSFYYDDVHSKYSCLAGLVYLSEDGTTWELAPTPSSPYTNGFMYYGGGSHVYSVNVSGSNYDITVNSDLRWDWRLLGSTVNSSTGLCQALYWRLAESEPASYTFLLAASVAASAAVVALSRASPVPPAAAQYGGQGNASSSTVTAPELGTWASSDGVDVGLFGTASATGFSPPTNYSEMAEGSSSGTTTEASLRRLAAATTVGSIAATAGSAALNVGHHVFIKPLPALAAIFYLHGASADADLSADVDKSMDASEYQG